MAVSFRRIACLAMMLAIAASTQGTLAADMWMPETGEMRLEDLPRETVEARRRHALALIGAGQWSSGAEELRLLLEAEPDAPWAAEARFAVARGMLAGGRARQAFEELARVGEEFPASPYAALVRTYQRAAAQVQAGQDPDAGAALYDLLIDTAADADEAALFQRDKADAFFRAGRYLDAKACYLELFTLFPRSRWRAYASYRWAECEWQMARRLGLGLERMESAEQQFDGFAREYPADAQAEDAVERVADVRAARATFYWEIARFYVDAEKKPWAAIVYLKRIIREFPDAPEAEWAAAELGRVRAGLKAPLRGDTKELPLPGVATSDQEP